MQNQQSPRSVRRKPGLSNLSRTDLTAPVVPESSDGAQRDSTERTAQGSRHPSIRSERPSRASSYATLRPSSSSDAHSRPFSDSTRSRTSSDARSPPHSRPPSRGRLTTAPVTLSFEQLGFSEMVVYANTSSRVQYHISVHMNCFCPSSFITVVRRWRVDGELIGSFEMGISTQRAVANMFGCEKMLDSVLSRSGKKYEDRLWQWRWGEEPGHALCWHRDFPTRYCYYMDKAGRPVGPMVAVFTCQGNSPGPSGAPSRPAKLMIYPHGLEVAHYIVVSALVVERKRLTPASMAANPMFN